MSIFMSKFAGDDYSAMQGPCPTGYHVPQNTEWKTVYDIWVALGGGSSDGTNFGITLKLPFVGYRSYSSSSINTLGTHGDYWSSIGYSTADYAYNLDFSDTVIYYNNIYNRRASGLSIRPFKNAAVIPDQTWTKLYGTSIEAGGIFWSSTDGLISLSSDGQTWITISDKNLGATVAWNSGDTLSQANCGNYYQWGNNYGFPHSGTVTTSSTRVNASNYGPGNYYSSSTFITASSSPYDRSNVQNDNLWGGETGVVQSTGEPKKIYIRVEAQPITTAGIYHNSDLGLISLSSDGSNWLTIADKNLGATAVYNSLDTLSESNCGKYYQWGNNYGFPFTGATSTSSTKVNAGNYGPGNYYSNSTFRYINGNPSYWDTSYNKNLRGGEDGTVDAMQGPCNVGYHIPSNLEYSTLYNILSILSALDITYLKIPKSGMISGLTGAIIGQGSYGYLWTASYSNDYQAYDISSGLNSSHYSWKTHGVNIRPFKNEAVQPDDSRTKLY